MRAPDARVLSTRPAVRHALTAVTTTALLGLLAACGGSAAPADETTGSETSSETRENPLGYAEVRSDDGDRLITRLYEGSITLSDGRTLPCVVSSRSAVTCEWGGTSPELERLLTELLEEKTKKQG